MTLEEIAEVLDPPVTAEQLMRIINQLPGLRPAWARAGGPGSGKPGPPAKLYDLDEVMELHGRLSKPYRGRLWLPIPVLPSRPLEARP
jgi:hypothetical protein